jgi:F0F1-type ATP synthase assembly protein I
MGNYFILGAVGIEMVAPIALGLWIDNAFETSPWGVVAGTVLGLVGGLWHLIILAKRVEDSDNAPPKRDKQ